MWSRVFLLALILQAAVAFKVDCPRPCILIDKCPDLIKLIQTNPEVVQEATCQFQGQSPLVCCPASTHEPLVSSSSTTSTTTSKPSVPNPLLPKSCGHFSQDDRIHGGNETAIGTYPWMAALGFKNSITKKPNFLCGGSVINERYILTAAHCFRYELEVVRLGEWDLSTDIDCETSPTGFKFCAPEPPQDFQHEEIIKHSEFSKRGLVSDDIALIRLARPITFNQWIQPVCLPDRDMDVPAALGDRWPTITGWGFTEDGTTSDRLLQVSLPLVDMAPCNKTYEGKLVGKQLCFGGTEGQDSCGGDSGGPLVMSEFSAPPYTQIGVVSFGPTSCGQKDVPGVYASVPSYRDWIDENMRP
ncbi:phenoloxidase-activating factor 1-like isoform X2 [Eriocheir sinensis]|uniref:phenoloxidase-activating factor 1-like isoform X2 n=1 Tax=Eriocheir sinensis TaxID=95602 RepID=UPI0021C695F1|nr:phenoloxidase-activating factor 1-like isoform X2 [Eriocheir sinensis]